ncbi:hypothetical protein IP88_02605 [alpha proteobacterium AAP81b]|nr:hypothetical protein IP88_02605 [alpha proteobacterium AAP81b]
MQRLLIALLLALATPAAADPAALARLESGWAGANYGKASDAERIAQLDELIAAARALAAQPGQRATATAWEGMLLMTKAGIVRGLSGFRLVQEARGRFDASIALDPRAAGGLALRQLGTLYWQVPGFPIAFGSKKKAEALLTRALAVDRASLGNNLAMADFLVETKRNAEAEAFLTTALRAPAHGAAELGLRGEAVAQLGRVRGALGKPWNGAEVAQRK